MRDIIQESIAQVRRFHRDRRRYTAILLVLAFSITLFVNWQLHGVGISMTAEYQCGMEEHEHTADCYEKVLTCGYVEGEPEDWNATPCPDDRELDAGFGVDAEVSDEQEYEEQTVTEIVEEPHVHTDDCYEERTVLTCLEEEHVHDDDCFDPETNELICDKFEHTHDDSCYTVERELVCGLEEGELVETPVEATVLVPVSKPVVTTIPENESSVADTAPIHHHTDACYTEVLTCTKPEHHHTVECLSDPLEDVEDETEWLAKTDTNLTGAWPEDLIAVAKSQLGYEESVKNFQLDTDDGVTLRGYSRYGAWYGNKYGEWDVMFLSYCLHYAGVPQTVVPQRAGVLALRSDLRDSAYLQAADGSTAQPGDIVIYNTTVTETVAQGDSFDAALSDSTADVETGFDDPYGIALYSADAAEDADTVKAGQTATVDTATRQVAIETVGIVTEVDEQAGTLTVISGDVSGKVAEVQLTAADVTDVFDLNKAYAEQRTDSSKTESTTGDSDLETGDGFGAVINWVGKTPAEASEAAVLALVEGEVELKDDWITNVTFNTKINDVWTPIKGNEVTAGENVQFAIRYKLPENVLGNGKGDTLYYQLPMTVPETQTGDIKELDGTVVGKYTIDTDGMVHLKFTEAKYTSGAEFEGTFAFTKTLQYAENSESNKVTFKNEYTLEVKKPNPDLNVKKAFNGTAITTNADGSVRLNYKVTASTVNGTEKNVTIVDKVNEGGTDGGRYKILGRYDTSTIILQKKTATGTETIDLSTLGKNYSLVTGTEDWMDSITIENLPALKAGESYILSYSVDVPNSSFGTAETNPQGKGQFRNHAFASSGTLERNDWEKITMDRPVLSKKPELDRTTGLIKWTITVQTPHSYINGNFWNGWKIQDVLGDPVPEGVEVVGNVTITGSRTVTVDGKQFMQDGYQFDANKQDGPGGSNSYTIILYTTTPKNGGTVVNTAKLVKGDREYTADADISVGTGDWQIHKTHVSTAKDTALWNISADNATGADKFTLTDTIGNAADKVTGQVYAGTHYAYAAELQSAIEAGLTLTLRSGKTMTYAEAAAGNCLTIQYRSRTGGAVDAENSTTPVTRFSITVNKSDDPVRVIAVNGIPTHEDRTKTPGGDTWGYTNTASVNGVSSSAEDEYRSYKNFEKLVSTSGENGDYQSGIVEVDKSKVSGGNLHYQLVLSNAEEESTDIVVTDILPEGVAYDGKHTTLTIDNGAAVTAKDGTDFTAGYNAATRELKLVIQNYNKDGTSHTMKIHYQVKIKDDDRWNDLSTSQVSYLNTASWGELTASTRTDVKQDVKSLSKSGTLNGNTATYQVVINPTGADLAPGQEKITLKDTIKASNAGAQVYGRLSSVKLYYYAYDSATGVHPGDEVAGNLYQIKTPSGTNWLEMEIPNKTALILTYECEVQKGAAAANFTVTNTVELMGIYKTDYKDITYTVTSDATVSQSLVALRKKDVYSGAPLAGATFRIEKYSNGSWVDACITDQTTGSDGLITLKISNDAGSLQINTLYRFVETQAPTDYLTDTTPHYVLPYDPYETHSTPQAAFEAATGAAAGTASVEDSDGNTIELKDVTAAATGKTTQFEVANTSSKLTVTKLWLDQSTNKPVEPQAESIEVVLYQYTGNAEAKKEIDRIYLNKSNQWTYTWSGDKVPLVDKDGNPYHYLVEELTTGNWNVVYDNNGIQTGEVTVINRVYTGFELPSTGGSGTRPFALAGGALMGGAALLLFRKRRKRDEKGV